MICLSLMSWQGFSCSFATCLILVEGLDTQSSKKVPLFTISLCEGQYLDLLQWSINIKR